MDTKKCSYCGFEGARNFFSVDHIVPVSKGGTDAPENLTVACKPCNFSKGSKDLEEFLKNRGIKNFKRIPTPKTPGRDKHYKKFSQRLSEENQEWLKRENKNYPSWNLFFDEMRNRYEAGEKMPSVRSKDGVEKPRGDNRGSPR